MNLLCAPVVHGGRGHEADPRVAVLMVVPGEELAAEGARFLDGGEAGGEGGPVLERFELCLRVGVVIRCVRSVMCLGHAKVGEQEGYRLGGHRAAAIGVHGKSARGDLLLRGRLADERPGELCRFTLLHGPADDVAAEDVEDGVEVVVGPGGWALELGDVPTPDLVWSPSQKLGPRIDRVAELVTALAQLAVPRQQPVHGALGAEVATLIEEGRPDRRRR